MNSSTLFGYVKDKKRHNVGILIGVLTSGKDEVVIGWSRCRKDDTFDRSFGLDQAFTNLGKSIPPSFVQDVKQFRVRCFRYFKDAQHISEPSVRMYSKQSPKVKQSKMQHNKGHKVSCDYPFTGKCVCNPMSGQQCAELAWAYGEDL